MSNYFTPLAPTTLARRLGGGRIWLPGDDGYEERRLGWALSADLRPAAIAIPHSVDEVIAVVKSAAAAGMRVAPQSTGHGARSLAKQDLSKTVIVRLSEFTGVEIDAERGIARVLGGTLWQDVVAAAAPFGYTAVHGSSGDVAVAGFALSGGLSFYGREHGLSANHVSAVELVTADGELLRASAEENDGLFWALRGGGGNFGVVTAVEIRLLPFTDVYAGMLLWDRERSPEVLRAWVEWTKTAPDSVSTSFRFLSLPRLPELPPFLAGRDVIVIDGAVRSSDEEAGRVLAPLRALAPELDTFARIPSTELIAVHMDPTEPTAAATDHRVLAELPEEGIQALLARVGPGTSSGLVITELRQLGGALAREPVHGGAIASISGAFAFVAFAMSPVAEKLAEGLRTAQAVAAALDPWATVDRLLTFSENPIPGEGLGAARTRLSYEAIRIDPRGVFQTSHPIR